MSLLLDIPKDLFVEIWSEWLRSSEHADLDLAVTSTKYRESFLNSLTSVSTFCFKLSLSYLHWIQLRGVKLRRLSIRFRLQDSKTITGKPIEDSYVTAMNSLDLEFVEKVDLGLFPNHLLNELIEIINKCRRLIYLIINMEVDISEQILDGIVGLLPQLTKLHLITSNANHNLSPLTGNCHKLKILIWTPHFFPFNMSDVNLFILGNPYLRFWECDFEVPYDALYEHCPNIDTIISSNSDNFLSVRRFLMKPNFKKVILDGEPKFRLSTDIYGHKSLKWVWADYDQSYDDEEDRVSELFEIANLAEIFIDYRDGDNRLDKILSTIIENSWSTLQSLKVMSANISAISLRELLTRCSNLKFLKFDCIVFNASDDEEDDDEEDIETIENQQLLANAFTEAPNKLEKLLITGGIYARFLVPILQCCPNIKYASFGEFAQIGDDEEGNNYKRDIVAFGITQSQDFRCDVWFQDYGLVYEKGSVVECSTLEEYIQDQPSSEDEYDYDHDSDDESIDEDKHTLNLSKNFGPDYLKE